MMCQQEMGNMLKHQHVFAGQGVNKIPATGYVKCEEGAGYGLAFEYIFKK